MTETKMALQDVIGGGPPVEITVDLQDSGSDDGVIIGYKGDYRIVIENVGGSLLCRVWATPESICNDPTDEVQILDEEEAPCTSHSQ